MPTITGKQIGPVGYGLMGLTWRQNPPPTEQSFSAMEAALAAGANFWNGGEFYGPPEANSLQLLNKYFTKHPEQADNIVLSVKGGLGANHAPDGSKENVNKSVDNCIKLLGGKKHLDIFECARVDPKTPIEVTIGALAELIKAGKLSGISLSECSEDTIRRAAKVHKIECVEVEFSLWSTDILDNGVAKACAELSIPIVAYSPLGRGILTGQIKSPDDLDEGDMRKSMPRFQPGNFEKNIELVREIEKIAKKKGCTPGQVATSWVLAQSKKPGMPLFIPIPGASHQDRVKENTVTVELSKDEEEEVSKIIKSLPVVGDRYGGHIQHLNFGSSPPLQS